MTAVLLEGTILLQRRDALAVRDGTREVELLLADGAHLSRVGALFQSAVKTHSRPSTASVVSGATKWILSSTDTPLPMETRHLAGWKTEIWMTINYFVADTHPNIPKNKSFG